MNHTINISQTMLKNFGNKAVGIAESEIAAFLSFVVDSLSEMIP